MSKEAESVKNYELYKDKIGETISGIVKRMEFGNIVIDLGNAEGVIKKDEMIPRENLRRGDKIITSGGIIGTINKVADNRELNVEISDNVEIKLGGETSYDVYPKGWDKTFALQHFEGYQCWFVGDRCGNGGNDQTIYERLRVNGRSFEVKTTKAEGKKCPVCWKINVEPCERHSI